jgi:hypothetical protein
VLGSFANYGKILGKILTAEDAEAAEEAQRKLFGDNVDRTNRLRRPSCRRTVDHDCR